MDLAPKLLTAMVRWNEHGCPLVEAGPGARVELSVHRPDPAAAASQDLPPQPDQVLITGNRAGLVALGAWLLALAVERSEPGHQHFDNEVSFGFYHSAQGWELVVERTAR